MQTLEMLTDKTDCRGIVNAASVPKRSPFRYPGGKTWVVPRIRQWLRARGGQAYELTEPFAGGGMVSLTAAFENLVRKVTLVELDPDIAAVWNSILNGGATWLADKKAILIDDAAHVKEMLKSARGLIRHERRQAVSKEFIFVGTLIRREFGKVIVEADDVENAKKALAEADWVELSCNGGETDFEWDGSDPVEA